MSAFLAQKVVNALPVSLDADTVYFVRVGAGFDLYVTNHSGTIVAYPINAGSGGTGATNIDGGNASSIAAGNIDGGTAAG